MGPSIEIQLLVVSYEGAFINQKERKPLVDSMGGLIGGLPRYSKIM